MKLLILSLIILSSRTFAAEIMDAETSRNLVTMVKDVEVESMLKETKEFQECRDKYKTDPSATQEQRTAKLREAETCFKEKLGAIRDPKRLEQLADTLQLQNYGLIKSKNLKDIQKYLNDKLYKAMTGVDPLEQERRGMIESFKKKKHIDQKIFIEMYKTQLGKNALFEISRFCFEDLRAGKEANKNAPPESFAAHWKNAPASFEVENLNDQGIPSFGKFSDSKDKTKIYEEIFKSIKDSDSPLADQFLGEFYMKCGKIIGPLCEDFQKNLKGNDSKTDAAKDGVRTKGSAACLARDRIQKYRKALAAADKLNEYFEKEMAQSPNALALASQALSGEPIKILGNGANDPSVDDLTNYSSMDFVEGGNKNDDSFENISEKCIKNPELSECEAFLSSSESFEKAKQNVELEMTLKKEVELARVKELVGKDRKNIEDYLESNGYLDLLAKYRNKELNDAQLEQEISKIFEAKKVALLEGLNSKVGKRQSSKDDDKSEKGKAIEAAVQESKEERARLAQVVLFNNIITSHLALQKKNSKNEYEELGRNISPILKEKKDLEGAEIQSDLFSNLKTNETSALGKGNQFSDFSILDDFLGKPETK
jgi:hypothetical protein